MRIAANASWHATTHAVCWQLGTKDTSHASRLMQLLCIQTTMGSITALTAGNHKRQHLPDTKQLAPFEHAAGSLQIHLPFLGNGMPGLKPC